MPFYAVANGRTTGIFTTWAECTNSVKGFKNAMFKNFDKREDAEHFIKCNTSDVGDFTPDYYVYTDGSCIHNGKPNAKAGIGIFFGVDDPRNVSKRIEGKQTNNRAELTAIIEAYYIIEEDIKQGRSILIMSDSLYSIRSLSSYGEDIPNIDLVTLAQQLYHNKPNVKFLHVKAHTGYKDIHSVGNDGADRLANQSIN